MAEVRVTGLLFDNDGVLVDSTELIMAQWTAFAGWYGLPAAELLANVHGRPARDVITDVAGRLPVPVEVALARLLADPVSIASRSVGVLPGARELLASLPPYGWAVVTSGIRLVAEPRLASAGLPTPPVLVTADDIANGKPDPEPYLLGAKRLELSPADCLVVEDAPVGLASARAAGCRTLALRTTHAAGELSEADYQATDLSAVTVTATADGFVVRISGG